MLRSIALFGVHADAMSAAIYGKVLHARGTGVCVATLTMHRKFP